MSDSSDSEAARFSGQETQLVSAPSAAANKPAIEWQTRCQDDSDDEPLVAQCDVNIADIDDDKPLRQARKRKFTTRAARNDGPMTFSRIERLIEQQLLEDKEQPIWNASDGVVQNLLDDTLPLVAPRRESAQLRKPTKTPQKVSKKASRTVTKRTLDSDGNERKKWRFRQLDSDESSDDEPKLELPGDIDDMVRNAEKAARNAGEGAPDAAIVNLAKNALEDLLEERLDEMITEKDFEPKVKRSRVTLGPIEGRIRRMRDSGEPIAKRSGLSRPLVKKSDIGRSSSSKNGTAKSQQDEGWPAEENSRKPWWKKETWDDDKGDKWGDTSNWNAKSWGEKSSWGESTWQENPSPAPLKKLTLKITANLKKEFVERRNGSGLTTTIGSHAYGQVRDPIAATRNTAKQIQTCADYVRMAACI